jgi:hypothetical protein
MLAAKWGRATSWRWLSGRRLGGAPLRAKPFGVGQAGRQPNCAYCRSLAAWLRRRPPPLVLYNLYWLISFGRSFVVGQTWLRHGATTASLRPPARPLPLRLHSPVLVYLVPAASGRRRRRRPTLESIQMRAQPNRASALSKSAHKLAFVSAQ